MRSLLFRCVLTAVLVTSAGTAHGAGDKAACVGAYGRTQQLRKENRLREAREQLLVCTSETCPKLVRKDCVQWMQEVTASLPTLVFAAHDARGRDRTDARVFVDGEAVTEQLGQEVIVDPGVHKVRFEADGAEPLEQEIVVRAGEKARTIAVTLADPKDQEPVAPVAAPPPRETPSESRSEDESRPLPVLVPVLGGLGLAAAGAGALLAVTASSQLDDMRSTCAPHCEQSDVDAVNLRYQIAAISGGAGALALGAAIWLFVTRPSAAEKSRGTTVGVSPTGLGVSGRF